MIIKYEDLRDNYENTLIKIGEKFGLKELIAPCQLKKNTCIKFIKEEQNMKNNNFVS